MNKKQTLQLETIKHKLRECSLKITPQRIFKIVMKDNPYISFDTVNRTLISFAECGIFNIVEGYSSAKCYDHITDEHHHYRCVECNTFFDCYYKPYNALANPDDVPKNFKINRKRVIIEGLCEKCK